MSAIDTLADQIRQRLHVPPGVVVLLVVLVLLYGFSGAVTVLGELIMSLLAAMVGGGDHEAVTGVLWRTLPLAIAAAGITFTLTNRWLHIDSMTSWVWMALIVLFAAVIGNAAHDAVASRATSVPQVPSSLPVGIATFQLKSEPSNNLASVQVGQETSKARQQSLSMPHNSTIARPVAGVLVASPQLTKKQTAWQRLVNIEWLKAPDLSRSPKPVEPLPVVPKGPGIYGGVGGAINQLLGYLVDYEPRLFLASIIAGGFVGWRVQRKVAIANAVVSGDFSELSEREVKKLAA